MTTSRPRSPACRAASRLTCSGAVDPIGINGVWTRQLNWTHPAGSTFEANGTRCGSRRTDERVAGRRRPAPFRRAGANHFG
jgi:hypothetical protein